MKKKNLFFILSILIFSVIFVICLSPNAFAAYPKLVTTLVKGFESIKSWIIKIATPAAAVAVRYWCFYEKI